VQFFLFKQLLDCSCKPAVNGCFHKQESATGKKNLCTNLIFRVELDSAIAAMLHPHAVKLAGVARPFVL